MRGAMSSAHRPELKTREQHWATAHARGDAAAPPPSPPHPGAIDGSAAVGHGRITIMLSVCGRGAGWRATNVLNAWLGSASAATHWIVLLYYMCIVWRAAYVACANRPRAAIGRLSSIDLVLDCMGSIRSIHLYGKRYRRIFFTIDYEVIVML